MIYKNFYYKYKMSEQINLEVEKEKEEDIQDEIPVANVLEEEAIVEEALEE